MICAGCTEFRVYETATRKLLFVVEMKKRSKLEDGTLQVRLKLTAFVGELVA